MLVEYTVQEAQLIATLLNNHKQQTEATSGLAATALDKLVEASKIEAEIEGEATQLENE